MLSVVVLDRAISFVFVSKALWYVSAERFTDFSLRSRSFHEHNTNCLTTFCGSIMFDVLHCIVGKILPSLFL